MASFSTEGLTLLLARLTEMGLDPTPGADGVWTAECPSCNGVLLIDAGRGALECQGKVA